MWVGDDRLLLGSDFPWTLFGEGKKLVAKLTDGLGDVVGDERMEKPFGGLSS
jgi:hypothetical protein